MWMGCVHVFLYQLLEGIQNCILQCFVKMVCNYILEDFTFILLMGFQILSDIVSQILLSLLVGSSTDLEECSINPC